MNSKLYSYTLYIWREPNIGMNFNAMVHIFYITVPARIYTRERAFFFSHIYTYCLPSHLPFFRRAWRRKKGSAVRDSLRGDRTCMDLSKTIFYAFNRRRLSLLTFFCVCIAESMAHVARNECLSRGFRFFFRNVLFNQPHVVFLLITDWGIKFL